MEKRRFTIPICLVVSIMIALMTISTAIIAFTPTYIEGQRAALNTVDKLRASLISDTSGKIAKFFNVPLKHIRTLELTYNQSIFLPWTLTSNQTARFLGELMTSSAGSVLSDIGIWMPTQGIATTVGIDPKGSGLFIATLQNNVNGPLRSYHVDNVTFDVDYSTVTSSFPFSGFLLSLAPWFVEATTTRPPWKKWSAGPSAAYNEMQMTVTFRFVDSAGHKGAIGANIVPSTTSLMLSQLNIGPSARACLVHTASGIILGNSWIQPVEILNKTNVTTFGVTQMQYENLIAPDSIRMKFLRLDNLTEPLVRRILRVYSSQFLLQVPTPFAAVIGSTGVDDAFVDVFSVKDDFGLDVRVILIQPLADHVGEMYKVRDIVLAVVASSVAILILAGGWFGIVVTRPLARLGERMQLTAQLMDDGEDEELSALTEVCLIQASYNTMRTELNRAKSYLPQSVLQQDDSETETPSSKSQTPSRSNSVDHRSTTSSFRRNSLNVPGAVAAAGNCNAVHSFPKHLNTATALRRKIVSVAVFNSVGWHAKISTMLPTECLKYQEQYVGVIAKAVADERGVVDFFQGDHLVATYNAVNALPSCARRSTASALAAVVELRKLPNMPPLCVGIGIGQAVCGNSGSEKMHRFNIMGPVYSEAFALESVARTYRHVSPIVLSGLGFNEVDMEFILQIVDIVSMPAGNGLTERRIVTTVHSRKAAMNEEWMYELKDADNENPFRHVNNAFCQLLSATSSAKAATATAEGSTATAGSSFSSSLRDDLRMKLAQHQALFPTAGGTLSSSTSSGMHNSSSSSCINVAGGGGAVEFAGARVLANILASAKTDEDLVSYVSSLNIER